MMIFARNRNYTSFHQALSINTSFNVNATTDARGWQRSLNATSTLSEAANKNSVSNINVTIPLHLFGLCGAYGRGPMAILKWYNSRQSSIKSLPTCLWLSNIFMFTLGIFIFCCLNQIAWLLLSPGSNVRLDANSNLWDSLIKLQSFAQNLNIKKGGVPGEHDSRSVVQNV